MTDSLAPVFAGSGSSEDDPQSIPPIPIPDDIDICGGACASTSTSTSWSKLILDADAVGVEEAGESAAGGYCIMLILSTIS